MLKRLFLVTLTATALSACSGVDRSGEQPFPPTVRTLNVEVDGAACQLTGAVDASPNSDLLSRGFNYGNDTLRLEIASEDTTAIFQAVVEGLLPGEYYAVAYAANGVGKSHGDTLRFSIVW